MTACFLQEVLNLNELVSGMSYLSELHDMLSILDKRETLEYVIQIGTDHQRMPSLQEENLVEGCQSRAWLIIKNRNPLKIKVDADSLVVRGYLHILQESINERNITSAKEMETYEKELSAFIEKSGLSLTMTPSRTNAFGTFIEEIKRHFQK